MNQDLFLIAIGFLVAVDIPTFTRDQFLADDAFGHQLERFPGQRKPAIAKLITSCLAFVSSQIAIGSLLDRPDCGVIDAGFDHIGGQLYQRDRLRHPCFLQSLIDFLAVFQLMLIADVELGEKHALGDARFKPFPSKLAALVLMSPYLVHRPRIGVIDHLVDEAVRVREMISNRIVCVNCRTALNADLDGTAKLGADLLCEKLGDAGVKLRFKDAVSALKSVELVSDFNDLGKLVAKLAFSQTFGELFHFPTDLVARHVSAQKSLHVYLRRDNERVFRVDIAYIVDEFGKRQKLLSSHGRILRPVRPTQRKAFLGDSSARISNKVDIEGCGFLIERPFLADAITIKQKVAAEEFFNNRTSTGRTIAGRKDKRPVSHNHAPLHLSVARPPALDCSSTPTGTMPTLISTSDESASVCLLFP